MLQDKAFVTTHGLVRQRSRDLERHNALETASVLLSTEGSSALTVRALAERLGCSTSVIYTMFGGKSGLAEALYLEGFERLRVAFGAVSTTNNDPLTQLIELGAAYRRTATQHRHFYGLMFGQALKDFTPSPQTVARAGQTFETLVTTAQRCIDANVFVGDARTMAGALWIAAHGSVSLELAGHFTDAQGQQLFEFTYRSMFNTWFAPSASSLTAKRRANQTKPL